MVFRIAVFLCMVATTYTLDSCLLIHSSSSPSVATEIKASTSPVTRQHNSHLPAGVREFKYGPTTGKCHNAAGQFGLNPLVMSELFIPSTKFVPGGGRSFAPIDAECVNFIGFDFVNSIGESDYVYLINWNLRGANLNGAKLNLVRLYGDLSGVDISAANAGYSNVLPVFDKWTHLPEGCQTDHGEIVWENGEKSVYDTVCQG